MNLREIQRAILRRLYGKSAFSYDKDTAYTWLLEHVDALGISFETDYDKIHYCIKIMKDLIPYHTSGEFIKGDSTAYLDQLTNLDLFAVCIEEIFIDIFDSIEEAIEYLEGKGFRDVEDI